MNLPDTVAACIPDAEFQSVFAAAHSLALSEGRSEYLACLKGYRAVEAAGAVYSDGVWKLEQEPEAAIYVPPAEVIEAAKAATEQADYTAKLAAGEALTEGEIRKMALHFAKTEGEPEAEWGGRFGMKWAGRVMRKLHAEPKPDVEISGAIVKVDQAQHLVYGWASITQVNGRDVVDTQGDSIDVATLENAAHNFVLDSRVAGEMHDQMGIGSLVQSFVVTPESTAAMLQSLQVQGIPATMDLPFIGWWVVFKITDEDVWNRIVSGELRAFSVGGSGKREKVAA